MANGPEKKVKDLIKRLLTAYKPAMYYNMPVPAGYGTPMLDFVGCYKGRFFAIEAKAKGKKPTVMQRLCIEQMQQAGGAVFVVDGEASLEPVKAWVDAIDTGASQL